MDKENEKGNTDEYPDLGEIFETYLEIYGMHAYLYYITNKYFCNRNNDFEN